MHRFNVSEPSSTSTLGHVHAQRPSELLLRDFIRANENEVPSSDSISFLNSPTTSGSGTLSLSSPSYDEGIGARKHSLLDSHVHVDVSSPDVDVESDGGTDEDIEDEEVDSESDNPSNSDTSPGSGEPQPRSQEPSRPSSILSGRPGESGSTAQIATTTSTTTSTNTSNTSITSDSPSALRTSHVSLLGGKYLLFLNPQGPGASPTTDTTSTYNLTAPRTIQKCVNVETREQFTCKILPRSATGLGLLATYHRLSDYSDLVTPLHEVIMGPKLFYLIFPPNYGNVHAYLLAKKRLREEEAARLFKQMVRAVEYCHSKGIVLRDLKLGKFVFVDKTRTTIRLESLEDAVLLENESDDGLNDKHGCPNYVSPEKAEILRSSSRRYPGKATDIWGLGIMLYTMLVGRYPFNDIDHAKLFAKIRRANFNIPDPISPSGKCLIRCLLRKDPSARLTLRDVRKHPWVLGNEKTGPRSIMGSCGTQYNIEQTAPPPPLTSSANAFNHEVSQMDTNNDDQVVPEYTAR